MNKKGSIFFNILLLTLSVLFYLAIQSDNVSAYISTIKTDNDWNCGNGINAISQIYHNSTTGNTTCKTISVSNGSGTIQSVTTVYSSSNQIQSPITFIVFQNATGVYAVNGINGQVEFHSNDIGYVISNTVLKYGTQPMTFGVTCGTYNVYSPMIGYYSVSIHGCGEGQTIFKRMFNATYSQLIRTYPSWGGQTGYSTLKDFTIDGNYGHTNSTEEVSITGNGLVENVEFKNYNGIALELDNNDTVINSKFIGVNSGLYGSIEGIWSSTNSHISISNSDFENNRWGGIFAQGYDTRITNSIFNHNHVQSVVTGGGQIALVNGGIVSGNMILNGGGPLTSGIETNYGNYILTDNIITGNQNYGIATNGQSSTIIASNNYLKGNGHAISALGSAVLLDSNNSK